MSNQEIIDAIRKAKDFSDVIEALGIEAGSSAGWAALMVWMALFEYKD